MPKADENQSSIEEKLKAAVEKLTADNRQLKEHIKELTKERDAARSKQAANGEAEHEERTVLRPFPYRKRDPKNPARILEARLARPGETVLLLPDQIEKLEKIHAVGSVGQLAEQQASTDVAQVSDESLIDRDAAGIITYLNQHSDDIDEIDRIEQLEEERLDGPRDEVVEAIERIRAELTQ